MEPKIVDMWESGRILLFRCVQIPEVIGTADEIIGCAVRVKQKEYTPPPRCAEIGYMATEWANHWWKPLKGLFSHMAEGLRQDWVRAIKERRIRVG